MPIVEWRKFPNITILIDRIDKHRENCPHWERHEPCYDCHFGTITNIEEELETYSWINNGYFDLKTVCMELGIDYSLNNDWFYNDLKSRIKKIIHKIENESKFSGARRLLPMLQELVSDQSVGERSDR